MTATNSPLHQFKTFVGEELRSRHQWAGKSAWELLRKFNGTVESFWANGAPVSAVADFIHERYMEGGVKPYRTPTMAGMVAAGCKRNPR